MLPEWPKWPVNTRTSVTDERSGIVDSVLAGPACRQRRAELAAELVQRINCPAVPLSTIEPWPNPWQQSVPTLPYIQRTAADHAAGDGRSELPLERRFDLQPAGPDQPP